MSTEGNSTPLKLKFISNDQRKIIYDMLLQRSAARKLKKGATKLVALIFSLSLHSIKHIWSWGQRMAVMYLQIKKEDVAAKENFW